MGLKPYKICSFLKAMLVYLAVYQQHLVVSHSGNCAGLENLRLNKVTQVRILLLSFH